MAELLITLLRSDKNKINKMRIIFKFLKNISHDLEEEGLEKSIIRKKSIDSIFHKCTQQGLMSLCSAMLKLKYTLGKAPQENLLGHLRELRGYFSLLNRVWVCTARTPDSEVPVWMKLTKSSEAEGMLKASGPQKNLNL